MPVRERMREKEPKPPWAGKGGDGGSGPRGSRTPGSPIPKRPREPPEERVGGRGKPRRVAGAGRDRFGRPSSPPAPEGEPARRQAEPGTARAPPPFTRGGGGGSEGLEASSPGAPSRGGRPAERPDARGPGGGGAGPPVRRRRTPPLRSAKTCRVPPWRQRRNLPRKRTKSKTLSGGSLGSRVDEERS